jgi:quercetin dioxygenase-like cupin family protein
MAIGVGAAVATHVPEIDPATVPVGFLATHNDVSSFRIAPFARAVKKHRADVFVWHNRVAPGSALPWHTHPGPAIVTVVKGSITYEDAEASRCIDTTYAAGEGFVDRGFGHVHRAVAGADGVDFYVVYLLPPGSATHVIPTSAPPECGS